VRDLGVPQAQSRTATATVLLALVMTSACAGPALVLPPAATPDAVRDGVHHVWVVRHGWHTRVAVRQADVDATLWPESRDFGRVTHLEVGWGDRDFYPKPEPSIWDAIDPVIRATPAALHVGGFDPAPHDLFADQPVVRLSVPAGGIDRLARFIAAHYVRDDAGKPVKIRHGYYPRSAFYLATGRYHALTYNSNSWTASALRAAGLPVDSAVTAAALMRQAAAVAQEAEPRAAGH
jgi:uncharacterized protein (TIGR02117 family)